ncbi:MULTISPECIES: nucleotidyltransferase substrate binding protein [unclassified Nitratiruptor]|nr:MULTISPECIES: nucleotidyltransferase substrate binding protein [unclassified Nitratiruptor]
MARQRLQEAIDIAQDELDKDGILQRFEFTVEMLWKA